MLESFPYLHTIEGEGETEALNSPPQYSVVQGEGERLEVIMYYYKKKGRKKQAQKNTTKLPASNPADIRGHQIPLIFCHFFSVLLSV